MTIANLDYTILLCSDLPATKAFYRDIMKFPIEVEQDNWVGFRVGTSLLTLRPRGRWVAWHDGPAAPGSAAVQLAFKVEVPEVDEWYVELVANSVAILREPTDIPEFRHRTLFFRDPEANVIEIYAEY